MQKALKSTLLLTSVLAIMLLAACSPGSGPAANIDFTWLASAQNDVVFDATQLVDGEAITAFHWDFGDGGTQTTTQDVIHHQYAAAGDYTVVLTGDDALGNVYTVTHTASASL
jgi:hypothetical protein